MFELFCKDKNSTETEGSTSEYLQMSHLRSITVNKRTKKCLKGQAKDSASF